MRLYVGVTDNEWFSFLSQRPDIDEVNFWQPSGGNTFRRLSLGEPFLFKLHAPENFIVGGGFFTHWSRCPLELAWEAFGEKNGVGSLSDMRRLLAKYRHAAEDSRANYEIGCIILGDPFFFPRDQWLPQPPDFSRNLVQGKTYDAASGTGRQLWEAIKDRLESPRVREVEGPVWGRPSIVQPRLGQGAFHVLVTDTYERRCAVTREKALPVLQAAHIRPVTEHGAHRVDNGLLLRSDVHTLFDLGYLTITTDYRLNVSRRLRDDFDNGEHYCRLNQMPIWVPKHKEDRPNREFLEWHADTKFRR